jgi:hypothetical protein
MWRVLLREELTSVLHLYSFLATNWQLAGRLKGRLLEHAFIEYSSGSLRVWVLPLIISAVISPYAQPWDTSNVSSREVSK